MALMRRRDGGSWKRWIALLDVSDSERERINNENEEQKKNVEKVNNNNAITFKNNKIVINNNNNENEEKKKNVAKFNNNNAITFKNNKIVIKINNNNTIPIKNKKIVKKIAKKKRKREDPEVDGEAVMPERMREEIEGLMGAGMKAATWVVNKRMTASDVRADLSRLFIPSECEWKLEGLLSAEEMRKTRVQGKKNSEEVLVVKMVDGNGGVSDLDFKYWTSLNKYVFTNQWTQFVDKFQVKEGWIVEIWCFRDKHSLLCFGINVHP
ncbi:hypothetical protein Syun_019628 [Stephania yunnanensis]|uniref:TF-B3 domain-containing protein n=1 Tax=Stephania yunnanensis TaxID=152371 RepID=A0AAP0IWU8_9MAGN